MMRTPWFALAAIALGVAGCKFDETPIGPGREQVVVHGILDPGRGRQRILVERLLTGREAIDDGVPFDSLDPIASHGGSPVSDATVIVFGPAGDSVVATERRNLAANRGTGMYEFTNSAPDTLAPAGSILEIARGVSYRLRIEIVDGRVLTATTTVPDAPSAFTADFSNFNRDRQALFLFWDATPKTERYVITASSPRGAFSIFVDSLEFLLSGSLKNTSNETLSDVFVPGFTQDVTVAAVDENFHDYYRSENDDYTGRGLLSRVTGGTGVFGSLVLLRHNRIQVSADIDNPVEGTYGRVSGAGPQFFTVYVLASAGAQMEFSGSYGSSGLAPPGLLGTLEQQSVTLAFLESQSARDTALVIDGKLDGGTITGRIRGGGDVEYRRLTTP